MAAITAPCTKSARTRDGPSRQRSSRNRTVERETPDDAPSFTSKNLGHRTAAVKSRGLMVARHVAQRPSLRRREGRERSTRLNA